MKIKLTVILLLMGISCLEAQPWFWSPDQLPYAREGMSAAVLDDSIFYSGGRIYNSGVFSNEINIYDIGEDTWSAIELDSHSRWQTSAVSCNGKVFFAGGNSYPDNYSYADVDIYNKETQEWTEQSLSSARNMMGAVAHMNKVFFAGGLQHSNGTYYDVIDIYDTENDSWDTEYLDEEKCAIGATAAGGKVFFAGGVTDNGMTNKVEIYDLNTGEWDIIYLSEARSFIAAVAYGNMVYFAGGTTGYAGSDVVDIYNVEDEEWENTQTLSYPRVVRALKVKNALVFSGECDYIDASGFYWNANGKIDIYYPDDDVWDLSVPDLSPARIWYACASCDDKAYYAGGLTYQLEITDSINILKNAVVIPGFSDSKYPALKFHVYPNPFSSTIFLDYNLQQSGNVKISIHDNHGKQLRVMLNEFQQQGKKQMIFNAEKLERGIYFCVLKTSDGIQTKKMIKL